MIVVLEKIKKDNSKEELSILSLKPDGFTEIRFTEDRMQINSRVHFPSYLEYKYSEWSIKHYLDLYDINDNFVSYANYFMLELEKRFQVLDEDEIDVQEEKLEDSESKTINEDLGILGN